MSKFKIFIETHWDSKIGPEDIVDLIAENFVEVVDIQWEDVKEEKKDKDNFLS